MKVSTYNTILPINSRHTVIFNSLHHSILIIKNHILNPSTNLLSLCSDSNSELYYQLIDGKFLIEEDNDEVHFLQKSILQATSNKDEFILHINPTLDCNLNCWYCYENHIKGSRISKDTEESIKKLISHIIKNGEIKTLNIGFFGGEPLFHFFDCTSRIIQFAYNLTEIHGIALKIHFTSNGTLLNDKIIKFLSTYDCDFQITLDGGRSHHNKTRFLENGHHTFDRIIGNIHKLATNHIPVIVRVNYTQENVNSINEIYDVFASFDHAIQEFVRFDFERVWQQRINEVDKTENTISSIREKFRKNGYRVLINYLHTNATDVCYGDKKNYLMINYNGEIYGCTARDFISSNRLGVLENDGKITYDPGKYEIWESLKFKKKICHTCRIAPICGGGCRQRGFDEPDENICTLHYTEDDKNRMVMDLVDYILANNCYNH